MDENSNGHDSYQPVSLPDMLNARERRVFRQRELLEQYQRPLISFTLNIAGEIKNSPVLRRVFHEGLCRLGDALRYANIRVEYHEENNKRPTGCEAYWVVNGDVREIKKQCMNIEDSDALGRLFDLDVFNAQGESYNREASGGLPRRCLVCGKPGRGCASRRVHTPEEIQAVTGDIISDFFSRKDRKFLALQAVRALLYEVCVTPKPGLVDRANNGSHTDMDIFKFTDSALTLLPYFEKAVEIGQESFKLSPDETFRRLRRAGLTAEREMFQATNGVNTHKGVIFSLGCICGAAGRLWTPAGICRDARKITSECALLSRGAVERDFARMAEADISRGVPAKTPEQSESEFEFESGGQITTGQRLYQTYGLRGIRGEVADGFPSVMTIGLPALRHGRERHWTWQEAGLWALVALLAQVTDTNVIARGGLSGQQWVTRQAGDIFSHTPEFPELEKTLASLDRELIRRNLSPGGCADLLAVSYLLAFLSEEGNGS